MSLQVVGSAAVVKALFDCGAAGFDFGKLIQFKNGVLSPGAYLDCRKLQSHPTEWAVVLDALQRAIEANVPEWDVFASVATAGICHGSNLATTMVSPHVIVKKQEKADHGLKGLIDGDVTVLPDAKVVLVEDMSSTFTSTTEAMGPLETEGAAVVHTIAICSWGFPIFHTNVAGHDVTILCTGDQLVDHAEHTGMLTPKYSHILRTWLQNPGNKDWCTTEWAFPD